jgi:hypothetical protein
MRPPTVPALPPPERMTVTLSDDVGLTSTSPNASAQAAPDEAPVLGEPPAAEPAPPAPAPKSEPVKQVEPPKPVPPKPAPPQPTPPKPVQARPVPQPRVVPVPAPRPVPRPVVRPAPTPPKVAEKVRPAPARPTPAARPASARSTPVARPAATAATRPATTATRPATTATRPAGTATPPRAPAGGSRIGADFLSGVRGAQTSGPARTPPAATIGPAVRSALSGAISRELKPKWAAPQGVDVEKLVTVLTWNLNRDGSLSGTPRVVRQEGINDANRPQAQRHAEQAIRAVQLAAPFNLPAEYYDAWKRVAEFRFDRKLSQ